MLVAVAALLSGGGGGVAIHRYCYTKPVTDVISSSKALCSADPTMIGPLPSTDCTSTILTLLSLNTPTPKIIAPQIYSDYCAIKIENANLSASG